MENLVQFPGLGLEFMVNRVAFSIGSFNVYWYGVILASGLLLGILFAFRYAVDFGIDTDRMIDVIAIGTVMAIVCARIYYVALAPFEYQSLWEMIDLRNGGIAIYGSLIGAFVFGGLACKWRKIPLLPMFDLVALGFLIGQAVGRWGNYVNQEAFGTNTTLPWGMYSAQTQAYLENTQAFLAQSGITVDPAMPVHPTFLYESLWCFAGLCMLFAYFKRRKFAGDVFLLYAIWYGAGRFWIEGLRTDALMVSVSLNLRMSQIVAVVTVLAALILEILLRKKHKGETMMVPLAVANLKEYQKAFPDDPTVKTLAANAPHAEFVKQTKAWNAEIKAAAEAAKAESAQENTSKENEQEQEHPNGSTED